MRRSRPRTNRSRGARSCLRRRNRTHCCRSHTLLPLAPVRPYRTFFYRYLHVFQHSFGFLCRVLIAGGSHLSRRNTQLKVEEKYYWPTLISDVQRVVDACAQCAQLRRRDPGNANDDTAVDADAVSSRTSQLIPLIASCTVYDVFRMRACRILEGKIAI